MTSEYSIPVREIPIATLGQAKIPSPLPYGNMINTGKVMLSLSHEYDEDIDTHQTLLFEEAGPRQDLYFDPGKTKCAIVTCGGLCPGLNDVIRAIVLEAYHAYNTPSVLGIRYGLEGFIPSYSHNVMELTPASVEHIYQFGGTLLGSSRGPQEPSEIVDALERLNVSVLFVIGGDGSLSGANIFAQEHDIPIVGLPGTIDNDLGGTDATIGYDTALNTIMEAVDKLRDTASSHERLFFVEVMGHTAGYLALNGAIATGSEAAIIPEMDTEVDQLAELISQGFRKSKNSAIVIVAENPRTGGAMGLAERVKKEFPQYDARVTILGHIQRGGSPSAQDRILASRMGAMAIQAIMEGQRNVMIGIQNNELVYVPFSRAVRHNKSINRDYVNLVKILSM